MIEPLFSDLDTHCQTISLVECVISLKKKNQIFHHHLTLLNEQILKQKQMLCRWVFMFLFIKTFNIVFFQNPT